MDGFILWLVGSLSIWSLGEGLNCSFPYHDGEINNSGLICQWENEDFYYDEELEEWVLLPVDPSDNWIEEKCRTKYWKRRYK